MEILRLINKEHYFIFGPFLPILSFKDPNVQKMPFYLRSDFAMLKNFLGWFKKFNLMLILPGLKYLEFNE